MYLEKRYLKNLSQYKYSAIDKSIVSKYILTPYWNALVKLFPKTIAPNTITFLGLCMIFVNFGTMLWFDPGYGTKEMPRWVYYSWGIGLFAYQSMDAIDGKQARRTGMAGPLGEMFDHGCDAMNTTLEVLICAHALNLGRSWWTVASQTAALSNFYLTTWEEFHTGTLYLSEFSGPVEGILMICCIYFITGYYGPQIWDTRPLELLGLQKHLASSPFITAHFPWVLSLGLNDVFMIFAGFSLAFNVLGSYANVRKARVAARKPVLPPLGGLVPFVLSTAIMISWLLARPEENILKSWRFVPFVGVWGFGFAYQVGQLILAHVAKMPFPYWNGLMVWAAIGSLDANARTIFGVEPILQATDSRRDIFIFGSFLVAFAVYLNFAFTVIWAITNHLGIASFTVRKKDENGEWQAAADVDQKKAH